MKSIEARVWDKVDKFMDYVGDRSMAYIFDMYGRNVEDKYHVKMLYTCLRDKNGGKIYEGDIVKYHYYDSPENELVDEVVYKYGMFGVEGCATNLSHVYISESVEVIGNIHENPELLETSK